MSATSRAPRGAVQDVIRRVPCPRCRALAGDACLSGRQMDGKYPRTLPDSHLARWRAAIDAGHVPATDWLPLEFDLVDLGERPDLPGGVR